MAMKYKKVSMIRAHISEMEATGLCRYTFQLVQSIYGMTIVLLSYQVKELLLTIVLEFQPHSRVFGT